jgi:hypothetical protein
LSLEEAREVGLWCYGWWRWASYGLPTFDLTLAAAARFVLTDLRGISIREASLPFRAFRIRLPSGHSILRWDSQAEIRCIDVLAVGMRSPEGIKTDDVLVVRGFDREGRDITHESAAGLDQPCEAAIASVSEKEQRFLPRLRTMPLVVRDIETIQAMLRMVFNATLYAAHVRADRTRTDGGWKMSKSLGLPAPAVWIVGRAISLDRESVDAARAMARPGRSGWRIRSRFIVRGHWRLQAAGPARGERKRIWIQPHWKGPRDAREAVIRAYEQGGHSGVRANEMLFG